MEGKRAREGERKREKRGMIESKSECVFTHLSAIPDMSDFQYAPQPNITGNDIASGHSCHKFIKVSIRLGCTQVFIQCISIEGHSGNTT
ncbi:MAG: hypothetical protein MJE68_32970 [Proteobacteria bacterium]|nr:hypothetical protein [Pseudomonadota bacterium]